VLNGVYGEYPLIEGDNKTWKTSPGTDDNGGRGRVGEKKENLKRSRSWQLSKWKRRGRKEDGAASRSRHESIIGLGVVPKKRKTEKEPDNHHKKK